MHHDNTHEPDFGSGQKSLGIYSIGLIICSLLTLLAFGVVINHQLSNKLIFITIYASACLQFLVQLICFLRLNVKTAPAQTNVMSLIFTIVILISIIVGSLWIMSNLGYNMVH